MCDIIDDIRQWFAFIIFGFVVGAGIGIYCWREDCNDALPETYQIIVSDDVSFNDFNAVYEIVGRDGDIIRVKERKS